MLINPKLAVILSLSFTVSGFLYVRRVLVPYQRTDAASHHYPRGNLSDVYPRWLGARELILHKRDPYSPEVTKEIQIGYYGRALDPRLKDDPQDQQAFAYPVYVVFLFAPFVYIPFQIIQPWFYGFLLLAAIASAIGWKRLVRWPRSIHGTLIVVLLTLASMPTLKAIELQQLTLLVACFLVGCVLLLVNESLVMAGVSLACATIKPQLVLPLAAWLIFWAASDWRRRKSFLLGFFGTMGILIVATELVLRRWIPDFFRAASAYLRYTNAESLLVEVTDRRFGGLVTFIVLVAAAITSWRLRHDSQGTPRFIFAIAFILALTVVIAPTDSTYNQVLLLPGVIFLVRDAPRLWKGSTLARLVLAIGAASILWPWVAALGLTIASFILPAASVQKAWAMPFYTSIAIPLVVLALLFQYAFRFLKAEGLGTMD